MTRTLLDTLGSSVGDSAQDYLVDRVRLLSASEVVQYLQGRARKAEFSGTSSNARKQAYRWWQEANQLQKYT